MSRRDRGPSPLTRALLAIAVPLERLVDQRADDRLRVDVALMPGPRMMAVRSLGLADLGCWVEVVSRPDNNPQKLEPAPLAIAGRLVGIRKGNYPRTGPNPPTRVLVLQQGTAIADLEYSVDQPVSVAPREWS